MKERRFPWKMRPSILNQTGEFPSKSKEEAKADINRQAPSFSSSPLFFILSGRTSGCYPRATILNTNTNRAMVSQRPTTVMYCAKPFPVSAMASAPAAPAFP